MQKDIVRRLSTGNALSVYSDSPVQGINVETVLCLRIFTYPNDSDKICQDTGLSEQSVNALCNLHAFGDNEYAAVLDFLLLDTLEREREHEHRSVLDLLSFFLRYEGSKAPEKQIFCDGQVAEFHGELISKRAIALDNRIVENAALMEMEQALIDLKRIIRRKKVGEFNS